jgi:spore coat polysaccharide biosynthesis predicted glycosyltransferase SpsG
LLFVPVSGPFGMGEYARSLAIARGARARWPDAAIRFVLSREAPYAARTPFPATLLDSSPTFHSTAVSELLEHWQPDVVIFDNAGRTAQLRAAKRCGARVIYISARRRQRRKAFRLRWMHLIDEHWIAYPEFLAGALGVIERLKLDVMRRPTVRYLDVILDASRGPGPQSVLTGTDYAAGEYVLVVPGGGTNHPGARDAVAEFRTAARGLAAAGVDTIFVGPIDPAGDAAATAVADAAGAADAAQAAHAAVEGASQAPRLRMVGALPQADLAELMRAARLIVANGGSTLVQSVACGRPSLAVPVAGDQAERIGRCVAAGVAVAARLDAAAILEAALALWRDERQLEALAGRAVALGLCNGIDVAVRALAGLLTCASSADASALRR